VVPTNLIGNVVTEIPLGLSLDESEGDFILRRKNAAGTVISIPISREELFGLQETITSWTDRTVSGVKTQSGSVEAIVFQPVAQFEVTHEAIGEHILLTLAAPSGNQRTFGLAPRMAADLAEHISVYLDQMSPEEPRRQ
jgi:hypothetical protein